MTGFARRPLAVIVCCLFAGMQTSHAAPGMAETVGQVPGVGGELVSDGVAAKEAPLLLAANEPPVRLRMERKFNVLGKKSPAPVPAFGVEHPVELKKDDSYPMFVIADNIEGRTDEVTEAEGNVELRKAGQLLFADHVTHRPLDDEIEADGNVRLLQDGSEIRTPHLRLKVSEQIGHTDAAEYQVVRQVTNRFYQPQQSVVTVSTSNSTVSNAPMMLNVPNSYGLPTVVPKNRTSEASGRAERIDFEGENQMSLSQATYSTCKPDREDWYLKASRLHLDYDNDVGEATHTSLWFKDVPFFYWPVGSFSLNGAARSGFLHPWFSASTKNGLDVAAPYYWAIAPNYDLTLYPRYMSKRGFQLGSEVRYLDHYSRGQLRFEYMPEDKVENRERHALNLQYQQIFGRGFSGVVNWNEVSDDHYWSDMSSRLLQTSLVQLPQQLVLNYAPAPGFQSSMQWLRYQTLQPDPANPVARPYFLEPQLNFTTFRPDVLHTDLGFIGQYTRFTHPTQTNGDRVVLYPQVSVPFVSPAFQITPKIGLHMTSYALTQQTAGEPSSVSRTLPIFSVDSTMVFERDLTLGDNAFIQTLEPRLYYVNIPYRDQSRIPVFDTALSDFNFAQIFSENRYSGYDRINDANQLTAAVTTRFLDANTGAERFKAMLGQRYYFSQQRVVLPGETRRPDNFSNLVAAATGLVGPKVYADAAWEFNYREGYNQALSAGLRYQPDFGKVLSGSYRYNRDMLTGASTVDQIDIAGQWPINGRWFVVGRYNFSIRDKKLLEAIAGFEYNAGCWATRMVAQQLEATSGSANTTLFFQLELNDLGSVGSNPITMLRRSIPGYGKINELSNRSQLLSE